MTEPATLDKLTVYLRVSSDEQKQQGTIENQRREAERYLAAHDVTPYSWYANDGVSGKRMLAQRPEGQRLLADIAAGQVKTVLVCKLDRFGRTLRHMLDAVDQLTAAGCTPATAHPGSGRGIWSRQHPGYRGARHGTPPGKQYLDGGQAAKRL